MNRASDRTPKERSHCSLFHGQSEESERSAIHRSGSVGGGIGAATIGAACAAGANVFVAGSAVCGHASGATARLTALRQGLQTRTPARL